MFPCLRAKLDSFLAIFSACEVFRNLCCHMLKKYRKQQFITFDFQRFT